jgi:pantoate--beta-alanine ligase
LKLSPVENRIENKKALLLEGLETTGAQAAPSLPSSAGAMRVLSTLPDYDRLHRQWAGQTVALVPTMGALHEGHASLIRMARQKADVVVVSIFVNPLQFGPQEDLAEYPRPKAQDVALCRELGVDVVFYPTVETLYPEGLENVTTVVPPESLTTRFCAAFRPGHFTGVATVVLKLFNVLKPTLAIFGEKDAQQLMVIRRMVQDLRVPVLVVAHPTVREADGLALSSRNRYLRTAEERQAALCLYTMLNRVKETALASQKPLPVRQTLDATARDVLRELGDSAQHVQIQYFDVVDPHTFEPLTCFEPGAKVLIAALVSHVRLIDNMDIV